MSTGIDGACESTLPKGWAWSTIGAAVDVLDAQRIPVNRDERSKRPGTIPYYGATGQVDWIDEPLFDEELVLLGEDGAPFLDLNKPKAYLITGPAWVNNHAHVLRAVPGLTTNRFLKHYLDWFSYSGHVTGTTRLKLTQGAMRAMPFLVPPLAEQARIVAAIEEHLSRLDAAEATLTGVLERIRQVDAGMVRRALVGSWPIHPLSDFTEDQRYGTSARTGSDGEVPVLRMGNIQNGALDMRSLKYLPADHSDFPVCLLEPGDVLFNRTNSGELVGKTAVFKGDDGPVSFASYLIRVRLSSELLPDWVALAINSPHGRQYIDEVRTQNVGQSNVNGTKLKAFPIPVPPIGAQRERLDELDQARVGLSRLRATAQRANAQAESLRRSILAAAFAGRLVPQNPADASADALLSRIATETSQLKNRRMKKQETSR